jgi:hypothetical protein
MTATSALYPTGTSAQVLAGGTGTWDSTAAATIIGHLNADDTSYSVYSKPSGTGQTSPGLEVWGFGEGSVPADANIISVKVEINEWVANTSRMAAFTYELWDGTTAIIGAAHTGTNTTSNTNIDTFTFTGVTRAQLATLRVRVYAHGGGTSTASTGSIDYVRITVEYANHGVQATDSNIGAVGNKNVRFVGAQVTDTCTAYAGTTKVAVSSVVSVGTPLVPLIPNTGIATQLGASSKLGVQVSETDSANVGIAQTIVSSTALIGTPIVPIVPNTGIATQYATRVIGHQVTDSCTAYAGTPLIADIILGSQVIDTCTALTGSKILSIPGLQVLDTNTASVGVSNDSHWFDEFDPGSNYVDFTANIFGDGDGSERQAIQFKPLRSGNAGTIWLRMMAIAGSSDNYFVEIADSLDGAPLVTSSASAVSSLPTEMTWVRSVMTTPVSLVAGTIYYIRVRRSAFDTSHGIFLSFTNVPEGSTAVLWKRSDGVWSYGNDVNDNNRGYFRIGPLEVVVGNAVSETDSFGIGNKAVGGIQQSESDTSTVGLPKAVVTGRQATDTCAAYAGSAVSATGGTGTQASDTNTTSVGSIHIIKTGLQATDTCTAYAGSIFSGISVIATIGTPLISIIPNIGIATQTTLDTIHGVQVSESDTSPIGLPRVVINGLQATDTCTAYAGTVRAGVSSLAIVNTPIVPIIPNTGIATQTGLGIIHGAQVSESDIANAGPRSALATVGTPIISIIPPIGEVVVTEPEHVDALAIVGTPIVPIIPNIGIATQTSLNTVQGHQVIETDTASTAPKSVIASVGTPLVIIIPPMGESIVTGIGGIQVSETDTAYAGTVQGFDFVGGTQISETDTGIGGSRIIGGTQASDSNTTSAGSHVITFLGLIGSESDSASIGSKLISKLAIGIISETDTSYSGTNRTDIRIIGSQAVEDDAAIGSSSTLLIGHQVIETDSGISGSIRQEIIVHGLLASTIDTGITGSHVTKVLGTQASETDTGTVGTHSIFETPFVIGVQASETDIANTGSIHYVHPGLQVVETGTTYAGKLYIAGSGIGVIETNASSTGGIKLVLPGNQQFENNVGVKGHVVGEGLGYAKIWMNGNGWQDKPIKVWDGNDWREVSLKRWIGSVWVRV